MAVSIGTKAAMSISIGDKTVDKAYMGDILIYQRRPAYLTFRSPTPFSIDPNGANWDGSMFYSTDAVTWSDWDGGSASAALSDGEYKLFVRGRNNTVVSNGTAWRLIGDQIYCDGLITTLLDYTITNPYMGINCFYAMFNNCAALVTAPTLPATVLATSCYRSMFNGCSSLVAAPSLPATVLTSNCYLGMFLNCSSLITAPALPATVLAASCYRSMFNGCSSLVAAPSLPATVLAERCYSQMFYGCVKLTNLSELPATTLTNECYFQMYYGCTSIHLSLISDSDYRYTYRIPTNGTGVDALDALTNMFQRTGGTFIGTPTLNTIYYSNEPATPSSP